MRFDRLRSLAALAVLAVAACSDVNIPDPPTVAGTAGEYSAARFTLSSAEGRGDVLAAGGEVRLSLRADGTSAGVVRIPAGVAAGVEAREVSLAGRWVLENRDQVRLEVPGGVPLSLDRFVVRDAELRNGGTARVEGGPALGLEVVLARD